MIHTIDQILINGSQKIYNGYIYNFDYSPSFGSNPSYCTLNIISENGMYSIEPNDLQIKSADTIKIGNNITLQMYPIRYKFSQSNAGKVLEIRYIDTSIILDKKIVVLNGRQGSDGTTEPINPYSKTKPTPYPNDKFVGSCYIPLGKELLTSTDTPNDVLNVVYTFPMLIQGINDNGIIINLDSYKLIQNSNQFYYTSYIGSLRNVLSQWCTDLGYGFYWENNSLHFIDLTVPLILDTSAFDNAIQDANTTEVTIEDTIGRVACAFYGQDRELLNPLPGQDTQISIKCMTMAQIGFTQDQINSVKAAFMGEDFFLTYHLLLNSDYGNSVLGITARTEYINVGNSSLGSKYAPKASDDGINYNQFLYVSQQVGYYEMNWNFYKSIADYVGKYYYLGINYGAAKLMSKWEFGNPQFFDQLLPCSQTTIAKYASLLGAGNEQLNQFLIGIPYNDNDPNNPVISYQALVQSQLEAGQTPNEYDSVEGDLIFDMGSPSWQIDLNLDGNFVNISTTDAQAFLINNNINSYFAKWVNTVSTQIVTTILNTDQPINYDTVIAHGKSVTIPLVAPELRMYVFPQAGTTQLNVDGWLKTPEELYPDLLLNVYIANIAMNVQPKIEEFFRSETDKTGDTVNCNSNVIKNEMNFRQITREDLLALGNLSAGSYGQALTINGVELAVPAIPSPTTLEEAFVDFSQNLTLSKVDPTIIKTYSLPYIDLPNNYTPLIGNGLMNIQIRTDEKGVNSTYTMGTRLMQVPSLESIRQNLEFQKRTNQSRFVPYGYQQIGTITE